MKGYIVRKTKKTIFVKSTATKEEIDFVNKEFGKLGWLILPCKNEGKKQENAEAHKDITAEFEIPYDKVNKADIEIFVEKFLPKELYAEFIKASYTIKKDKKGKEKPSYHHIRAKDFIFKNCFPDRFKAIEDRRNETKAKEKELEKEQQDILAILKG